MTKHVAKEKDYLSEVMWLRRFQKPSAEQIIGTFFSITNHRSIQYPINLTGFEKPTLDDVRNNTLYIEKNN